MRNLRYKFRPITWMTVFSLGVLLLIAHKQASGQTVVGTECVPANQRTSTVSNPGQLTQQSKNQTPASPSSHLGPGSIDIIPASPTSVSNCIPFGNNTDFSFTGFIYRNVPAFTLSPGGKIAFDMGALNSQDTRRNIYFAVANKNPDPPVVSGGNVVSQGVKALSWVQVVSDTQIPLNPKGNSISGDYELVYTSEGTFNFPGGGLIVGFGSSPPGAYADGGCEQVLVQTTPSDASGFFYSRFFFKPDQTLGLLDDITSGGSAVALGGIVIQAGPSISGQKFHDLNGNGVKDAGEPGLSGWTIKLSGDSTASTVTDGSGGYSFGNTKPGNYVVSEVPQPNWIQSYPTPIPPGVHTVKLDSGQSAANKDFGNYQLGSIGGKKFRDFNLNGVDDGEPGVPGWPINLTGPVTVSTATDGAGNYVFQNLPPGTYTVSEGFQSGWLQTFPPPPGTHTVVLTSGATVTGRNFGNAQVAGGGGSISGMAFDDRNGNGVKDPGEPPISARRIELSGRGVNKATLTDPNGEYTFTNVGSGSITVQQFLPSGWVQTIPAGGQPYTFTLTSGQGRSGVYFGSRIVTDVEDVVENPKDYKLFQNFPNPFNPSTRLSFYLPKDSYVTLKIFNVLGVEVAPLLEGRMSAGTHSVVWDGGDAPSGIYVYRLNAENFVAMKKMVLMK